MSTRRELDSTERQSNVLGVEDLLPHRGRMKLIGDILALDDQSAVTRSVVAETWPLFDGRSVDPIVLIELVAQTAGIGNNWVRIQRHGEGGDRGGWIVGLTAARLRVDALPLGAILITRSENRFTFGGLQEVVGVVTLGEEVAAEVTLQLQSSDDEELSA